MAHPMHATQSNISYLTSPRAMPVVARWAISFAVVVTKWSLRQRSRKQLKQLDATQLKDIGLSRADAHYEATLPFWRP